MSKYRKKPIVIEAFQMTEKSFTERRDWPKWLLDAWHKKYTASGALYIRLPSPVVLTINTLEGEHAVIWGDYIIQGVKGEIYPCKSDIFKLTYEPVTE